VDWIVRLPRSAAGLELGPAASICFSCGVEATQGVQVWFENLEVGTVKAFKTRQSFEIPLCSDCASLGRGRWPKILGWSAIGLIGLFSPMFLAPYLTAMSSDEAWESSVVFGVGVALSLLPSYFATEHWSLKDQGGGFVEFVGAGEGFVDLRLADTSVAARVRAALA